MTVDLSDPAHVQALRQACKAILDGRSVRSGRAKFGRIEAIAVLLDPALTADLLRLLLERCGVAEDVGLGDDDDGLGWHPIVLADPAIAVHMSRVHRIIPALLDAPDRAAVMAALKGER